MKETKHQTLSCIASCTFSRIEKCALFSTWLCLNFANEIKFKFYCLMTLNLFQGQIPTIHTFRLRKGRFASPVPCGELDQENSEGPLLH